MKAILLSVLLATLAACGSVPHGGTMMVTEASDAPKPFGYAAYCVDGERKSAAERQFRESFCHSNVPSTVVHLTPERAQELEDVQKMVNAAITYTPTTAWDPLAARGDCKTY